MARGGALAWEWTDAGGGLEREDRQGDGQGDVVNWGRSWRDGTNGRNRRNGCSEREIRHEFCQRLSHLRCELMNRLGKGFSFLGACALQIDRLSDAPRGDSINRAEATASFDILHRRRRAHRVDGRRDKDFVTQGSLAIDSVNDARTIVLSFLSSPDERVAEWKRLVMLSAQMYTFAVTVLQGEASFRNRQYWARKLSAQLKDLPAAVIMFLENPADDFALACAVMACHGHQASTGTMGGSENASDIPQDIASQDSEDGASRQASSAVSPGWAASRNNEDTAVREAALTTQLRPSASSAGRPPAAAASARRPRRPGRREARSGSPARERPTQVWAWRPDAAAGAPFAYAGPMEGFSVQFDQSGKHRVRAYGCGGAPLTNTLDAFNFCVWAITAQWPLLEQHARTSLLEGLDAAGMKSALRDAFELVLKHSYCRL